MLSYEICKKLKDAGFPNKEVTMEDLKELWDIAGEGEGGREFVPRPTLSELIEACGDRFVLHGPNSLDVNEYYFKHPNVWTAYHQGYADKETKGTGQTPEEAVANLYLALHQK